MSAMKKLINSPEAAILGVERIVESPGATLTWCGSN